MTEQTNLFPQDERATLASIRDAMNRWLVAQAAVAEHSERGKKLRQDEKAAHVAWLKATTTAGQLTLPTAAPVIDPLRPETRETIQFDRRQRVRDHAVDTLHRCGVALSNKMLATYINQDPHGLVSLLEGDPRLEKFQSGREKNEQTQWRLRATVAAVA